VITVSGAFSISLIKSAFSTNGLSFNRVRWIIRNSLIKTVVFTNFPCKSWAKLASGSRIATLVVYVALIRLNPEAGHPRADNHSERFLIHAGVSDANEMDTLALSMIVRNGASDLGYCLASVNGLANEIVIADTGSTDGSTEIARQFGARVLTIPWEDDFAKARNVSLSQVQSDWVLILDADERLDASAKESLPSLLANKRVTGYQVAIRNWVASLATTLWDRSARPNDGSYPAARAFAGFIDHENVRLFRRSIGVYFTGRVHETVGWRIQETGGTIGSSPLLIHHMGMVRDAQERARKIKFYRDLGRLCRTRDSTRAR
jgi:hypothetical protein